MISDQVKKDFVFVNKFLDNLGLYKIKSTEWASIVEKQEQKGIAKYGHTIDDCPDDKYNWKGMMMEELADAMMYFRKWKKAEFFRGENL